MAKHDAEHERAEYKDGGETEQAEEEREHRRPRRAKGGKAAHAIHEYNAVGSPAMQAATDESEEFGKGGRAKKKGGGVVHGEMAKMRGDKMPRGRHAAGGRAGGSPFSSGRTLDAPKDDKAGRGHEGVAVPAGDF